MLSSWLAKGSNFESAKYGFKFSAWRSFANLSSVDEHIFYVPSPDADIKQRKNSAMLRLQGSKDILNFTEHTTVMKNAQTPIDHWQGKILRTEDGLVGAHFF